MRVKKTTPVSIPGFAGYARVMISKDGVPREIFRGFVRVAGDVIFFENPEGHMLGWSTMPLAWIEDARACAGEGS